MAKKNIKTSRYWTRTCPNCQFEYPNWFTNCPRCKATWQGEGATETQVANEAQPTGGQATEKTIRIIAQLTEDDVKIRELNMFFSADNGISWFSMPMVREEDYFVAEIANVTSNSTIVYYLKGLDEKGVEFIEDNNADFYYYYIGEMEPKPAGKAQESPIQKQVSSGSQGVSEIYKSSPQAGAANTLFQSTQKPSSEGKAVSVQKNQTGGDKPMQIAAPPEFFSQNNSIQSKSNQPAEDKQAQPNIGNGIQFTPLNQTKKDGNLKICPNCKSNVKSQWSVCPICGFRF
jgi:hypothetical protein